MKIYFKNKIISIGDGSKVFDEDKNPVLKVKGKIFTITNKKLVYDLEGNLLYKVRRKYWHFLKKSAYIKDAKGKMLMQIKEKHSILGKGFDVLKCEDDYNIEWGGFWKGLNKVYLDGELIGTVTRKIFSLIDAFELDFDNVDYAPILVAITVGIDIIYDGD